MQYGEPALEFTFSARVDEESQKDRKGGQIKKCEGKAITYSSPYYSVMKSRRMMWAGHVARKGEKRDACRILVGRPEGRRPLGRPRRRWEDNIKRDLQEVGWEAWTGLSRLRIGTGGGLL
jgi:hypothetical protein